MTNQSHPQRHTPPDTIDTNAIAARLGALASAGICPRCAQVIAPLTADTKALLTEVIRLHYALAGTRLESANRLAAMQAALNAAGDDEPDPLVYLRWELPEPGTPSADSAGGCG